MNHQPRRVRSSHHCGLEIHPCRYDIGFTRYFLSLFLQTYVKSSIPFYRPSLPCSLPLPGEARAQQSKDTSTHCSHKHAIERSQRGLLDWRPTQSCSRKLQEYVYRVRCLAIAKYRRELSRFEFEVSGSAFTKGTFAHCQELWQNCPERDFWLTTSQGRRIHFQVDSQVQEQMNSSRRGRCRMDETRAAEHRHIVHLRSSESEPAFRPKTRHLKKIRKAPRVSMSLIFLSSLHPGIIFSFITTQHSCDSEDTYDPR